MKNVKLTVMMISILITSLAFTTEPANEGLSKAKQEQNAADMAKDVAVAEASNTGNITAGLAGIGAGLVVLGAGFGIGRIFGAAAEATARQPEAANEIRSTVNLPLFLLEGVGIIGLVVCILAVVL